MSKKGILLFVCVIAGIIFLFVRKEFDVKTSTPKTKEVKTHNKEFDKIANEVENHSANEMRNRRGSFDFDESPYKGNQLANGASPFNGCFGKGVYSGNAKLTIKNGASTDAIICLYSTSRMRTIRNEYVRKNTNFTIENIPEGNYRIRVFYGNDWNPNLDNKCGTKGFFESDVSFSEFDREAYFEDGYDSYTVATVTLYTVAGGNASTSRISQSDFFNN